MLDVIRKPLTVSLVNLRQVKFCKACYQSYFLLGSLITNTLSGIAMENVAFIDEPTEFSEFITFNDTMIIKSELSTETGVINGCNITKVKHENNQGWIY